MKRILMLGGSHFQTYAIKKARDMGHYVITCDYLPNNPGHKLSNEYHNVSTTARDEVLALAKRLNIDGILAYASDPAAPIAAFVAENLGLPTSPYKSVEILTHKDLFRKFLNDNGFNTPRAVSFSLLEEAIEGFSKLNPPLILKPIDSSGSKGVFKIEGIDDLIKHFTTSLSYSRAKRLILEEWIEYDGYQVAGDGFSINGELVFSGFANEHFDKFSPSPFVPIGESFPYSGTKEEVRLLNIEIQRAISLLNMQSGAYNFDIRLKDKQVYFLELAPRNGGNLIPQVIQKAFGIDLVKASIHSSLGLDLEWLKDEVLNMKERGFYACYVLHSQVAGVFRGLKISDKLLKDIITQELYINANDSIGAFSGSNATLGIVIFKSSSQDEMLYRMENMEEFVEVVVDENTTMGGGCRLVVILLDLESLKHLPLGAFIFGYACNRFSEFQEFADHKSSSPLKFAKNSHSHTANIRMLLCGMESLDSGVESTLDSSFSKVSSSLDSKRSLESNKNNPHEVRTLKSVVGGGGESCERGGGERLRNLSPLPLSQGIDRVEDFNVLENSNEVKDTNKESNLASNADSAYQTRQDSILGTKDSNNLVKSHLDFRTFIKDISNSLIHLESSLDSKHPNPILRRVA